MPRLLLCVTGSSLMLASRQTLESFGIAVDAELHHEAVDHAEEAVIVEEAVLDQIEEAVGAVGRPVAMHLDDEGTLARIELHLVDIGRFLVERGWIGQTRCLNSSDGQHRDQCNGKNGSSPIKHDGSSLEFSCRLSRRISSSGRPPQRAARRTTRRLPFRQFDGRGSPQCGEFQAKTPRTPSPCPARAPHSCRPSASRSRNRRRRANPGR